MSGENEIEAEKDEQVEALLEEMGVSSSEDEESESPVEENPEESDSTDSGKEEAQIPESVSSDVSDALSTADAVVEKARAALASSEAKPALGAGREVPISAIVHLLGVSTAGQVSLIESKLDILTTRITTLTHKLERLSGKLDSMQNDALLDRVDFQLSDIKSILKKVLPYAMTALAEDGSGTNPAAGDSEIKTSQPAEPEKTPEDPDFQQNEAQRVRDEMAAQK